MHFFSALKFVLSSRTQLERSIPPLTLQHVAAVHVAGKADKLVVVAGVVAAMGVDGGSLFQYIGHILRFWSHRRKLHFRRIGHGRKKGKKVKAKK